MNLFCKLNESKDGVGRQVKYRYDPIGRLISVRVQADSGTRWLANRMKLSGRMSVLALAGAWVLSGCTFCEDCNYSASNQVLISISNHGENMAKNVGKIRLYDAQMNEVKLDSSIETAYVSLMTNSIGKGTYVLKDSEKYEIRLTLEQDSARFLSVECRLPGEDTTFYKRDTDSLFINDSLYLCAVSQWDLNCR